MSNKSSGIKPVILESGIAVKPVYGPEDIAHLDPRQDIGAPGYFRFTGGIYPCRNTWGVFSGINTRWIRTN